MECACRVKPYENNGNNGSKAVLKGTSYYITEDFSKETLTSLAKWLSVRL